MTDHSCFAMCGYMSALQFIKQISALLTRVPTPGSTHRDLEQVPLSSREEGRLCDQLCCATLVGSHHGIPEENRKIDRAEALLPRPGESRAFPGLDRCRRSRDEGTCCDDVVFRRSCLESELIDITLADDVQL